MTPSEHRDAECEGASAVPGARRAEPHDLDRDHRQDARREVQEEPAEGRHEQEQNEPERACGIEGEPEAERVEPDDLGCLLAAPDAAEDTGRERPEVVIDIPAGRTSRRHDLDVERELLIGRHGAGVVVARLEGDPDGEGRGAERSVGRDGHRKVDDGTALEDGEERHAIAEVRLDPVELGPLREARMGDERAAVRGVDRDGGVLRAEELPVLLRQLTLVRPGVPAAGVVEHDGHRQIGTGDDLGGHRLHRDLHLVPRVAVHVHRRGLERKLESGRGRGDADEEQYGEQSIEHVGHTVFEFTDRSGNRPACYSRIGERGKASRWPPSPPTRQTRFFMGKAVTPDWSPGKRR